MFIEVLRYAVVALIGSNRCCSVVIAQCCVCSECGVWDTDIRLCGSLTFREGRVIRVCAQSFHNLPKGSNYQEGSRLGT